MVDLIVVGLALLVLLVVWLMVKPIPDLWQFTRMLRRSGLPYNQENAFVDQLRQRWPTAGVYVVVPGPCDPLPIGSLWVFDDSGKLLGVGAWKGVAVANDNRVEDDPGREAGGTGTPGSGTSDPLAGAELPWPIGDGF